MYELLQNLIAFKYACKINHWSANTYASHLQYDRLAEQIDDWTDNIAESYFMARDMKKTFKPDLLNPKMIDKNLVKMCQVILSRLEDLQEDDELDEGIKSILGDVEALFLDKLALAKLA